MLNKNLLLKLGMVVFSLFFMMTTQAQKSTYTVSYSPKSKYQGPSLKNATLHVQLFSEGKATGTLHVKTDEKQSFTIAHQYPHGHAEILVVEITSVASEPKGLMCHGISTRGNNHIVIDCHLRYGKGHPY